MSLLQTPPSSLLCCEPWPLLSMPCPGGYQLVSAPSHATIATAQPCCPSTFAPVQSRGAVSEEMGKERESSRMKHSWHGMYLSALSAGTLEFLSMCVYLFWGGWGRARCYCCLLLLESPRAKHLSGILVSFQHIASIVSLNLSR